MGEHKIKILSSIGSFTGQFYSNLCPHTVETLYNLLPIKGTARRWGLEIYFSLDLPSKKRIPEENPKEVVEYGDLGYWPTGMAFCIFFGPTPASKGDEIRPASAVNVFGKLQGDLTLLDTVKDGEEVIVIKDE
jgi:hypothetical protein